MPLCAGSGSTRDACESTRTRVMVAQISVVAVLLGDVVGIDRFVWKQIVRIIDVYTTIL